MRLTILIPVFNEASTIHILLDRLLDIRLPKHTRVIIVDDGSTDNTLALISEFQSRHPKSIRVLGHKTNLGKGSAIRTGIPFTTGDYVLIQDADLEYDPKDIPKLLQTASRFKRRKAVLPAVYGSRFIRSGAVIPTLYYWGNRFLTEIINVLFHSRLTDMETGYKLLPRSFLSNTILTGKRFEIEPEITIKLIRNHIPILEVPISYRGRNRLAGKKLTIADALSTLTMIGSRVLYP